MAGSFENYLNIQNECQVLCSKFKNDFSNFQVLPVTKGQSVEKISNFIQKSGLKKVEFGENYYEEILKKQKELTSIHRDIQLIWHFMGRLQGRKIPNLMAMVSYFHGVCREKELQIISRELSSKSALTFRGFYIQVNISGEESKGGVPLSQVENFLQIVEKNKLSKFNLGFMGIASSLDQSSPSTVKNEFLNLKKIRDQFNPNLSLNMGMSGDYKLAIEANSNLIRIGTRIFGQR